MYDRKTLRKRMNEIFGDYAMDDDEEYVQIDMYFRKNNGEEQTKHLGWANKSSDSFIDYLVCASDIPHIDEWSVATNVHCPVCGSQIVDIRKNGMQYYVSCECGKRSDCTVQLSEALGNWGIMCNKAERMNADNEV